MVIRHRVLLLVVILCCVEIIHSILLNVNDADTCNALCKQCNASAVFANGYCECNLIDNSDEDAKCIQYIQEKIQGIDLNALSDDDLSDEERNARCVLKSRRRLRMGDADKVAQYFINGGPSAGHSHFVTAFKAAHDTTESATNSFSGINHPENEHHHHVQPYLSLTAPVSEDTHNFPLYMIPGAAPIVSGPAMSNVNTYTPILGLIEPTMSYPTSSHNAPDPMLGTIVQPLGLYRHGLPLHNTLLRAAALPGEILQSLLPHHLPPQLPVYHSGIIGGTANSPQDNLSDTPITVQQRDNDDNASCPSNHENHVDSSSEHNVAARNPETESVIPTHHSRQPSHLRANTLPYQAIQHQDLHSPYRYGSYYNPLFNTLHPRSNGYIVQLPLFYNTIPHYVQSASNPMLTSAHNPNSDCNYDANTQMQKDKVPSAIGPIVSSNNNKADKIDNVTKTQSNILTEKRKIGKYASDKSK